MIKKISSTLLLLALLLVALPSYAHTTSTSYLNFNLTGQFITGTWQVSLNDIHLVLGLDTNNDSKLIWSELKTQQQKIITELNRSIKLTSVNTNCTILSNKLMIDRRALAVFLSIPFKTDCLSTVNFNIHYNFLFEQDAFHKNIISIDNNHNTSIAILSYSNRSYHYDTSNSNRLSHFFDFIIQGIIHVLIGLDHVLFVICLLLSATLLVNYQNSPRPKVKSLLSNTFKLVTAFTIAHSITLILAATKTVSLSPDIIEPIIAFSVVVLAILNLVSRKQYRHWPIVFIFGLIHGFGFAFVLDDITLPTGSLLSALFGFNVGVELGQLIIVVSILPILYLMYSKKYYQQLIIPVSSVVIAAIGLFWFVQRTSDFV